MVSQRKSPDFVKFIMDATGDENLAKEFFSKESEEDLYNFFQEKGYDNIPLDDCADILESSKNMRGKGVNENGEPVVPGPGRLGY